MSTENSFPSSILPEDSWREPGAHSTKLHRSLYSGRAATLLREAIVDGSLEDGTPLVEARLAQQLAISRGPIRSALTVLEGEGLARTLSNGRMIVSGLSADDVRDLLATRYELEFAAVRWGLGREAPLDEVEAAMVAIENEQSTSQRLVDLDIAFHRALVSLSGSRFLLRSWLAIVPVIQSVITIGNRRLGIQDPKSHLERIIASHRDLVQALRSRQVDAVGAQLRAQFDLTGSMFADGAPPAPGPPGGLSS